MRGSGGKLIEQKDENRNYYPSFDTTSNASSEQGHNTFGVQRIPSHQGQYYKPCVNIDQNQYGNPNQHHYQHPCNMQLQHPHLNQNPYHNPSIQQYTSHCNQIQDPVPYGVPVNFQNGLTVPQRGQQGPQIILIKEEIQKIACSVCGYDGPGTVRRVAGSLTYAWFFFLFIFLGVIFSWMPFCIDGCKDTEILCNNCGNVKRKIKAKCCKK